MGPTETVPEQLTMFGFGQGAMGKPALSVGHALSRQELRVWTLHVVLGYEPNEVRVQMGLNDEKAVFRVLRNCRDKLGERYNSGPTETEQTEKRLASELRAGIRCSICNLLLPCRADGEDGPCDTREDHQVEAILNLIQFLFGNGRNSKDENNPGVAKWVTRKASHDKNSPSQSDRDD